MVPHSCLISWSWLLTEANIPDLVNLSSHLSVLKGSRHLVQDTKGKRRWNNHFFYNLALNTICCHFHIVLIIQLRESCIVCEYQEVKFTGPLLEIWHPQECIKLVIFEKKMYIILVLTLL